LQRWNRVNKYAVATDAAYLASLGAFSSQIQMNMDAVDEPTGTVTAFGQRYALGGPVIHGTKALLAHTQQQLSGPMQINFMITMAYEKVHRSSP